MPLFTPEEKKIFDQEVEIVKKGMLVNKRTLVSKYGKDAEKVIQGNAVKKALKKIENLRKNQEMENNRLKEMVKNALTLKEQDVEVRADKIGGEKELLKMMNLLDLFEENLKSHDWYYMMSDDSRAYTKGLAESRMLGRIAKNLVDGGYEKEAQELYDRYNKFKNVSFDLFISSSTPFQVKEDLDLGHEDNEPHDLKSQLYCIGKSAMELYQMVDSFEGKGEVDFPAWWQNKINTAKNMIGGAKSYLEFELKEPQIDAMVGAGMMNEEINQNNLQRELKQSFSKYNPRVSVYGNEGTVKFETRYDVNEEDFNSIINYLEGHNFVVDRKQSFSYYDSDDDREFFPRIRFTIKGPNTGNSLPNLGEKKLTSAEKKKKEEIVMAMKKDFKGPKPAMYAIATEKAKKVAEIIAKELKDNTSK